MKEVLLSCYLGYGALMDGKYKAISAIYLWIGGVMAFGFFSSEWMMQKPEPLGILFRLFPGIIFLVIGWATREKIGYGDGILLLILGGCLPEITIWQTWMTAIFLLTLWAIILLGMKRGKGETKLPFLPFLWAANLLLWVSRYA